MSTQRKVCGAVLALAGVAFGVDRWILGPGPSEAQAEQTAATVSPAGGPSALAGPARAGGLPNVGGRAASDKPAGRSLAIRLQEATTAERLDLSAVPDAFHASALWAAPKVVASAAPVAAPVVSTTDPVAEFRSRHKLTAVIKSDVPGGGLAMIDGKTVVPGETPEWLDGFEMVWVREGRALFRHGPVEVELRLEESKLKKDSTAR